MIKSGNVLVDAFSITDPSFTLAPEQIVICEGEQLSLPKPRYLMLNKPAGKVCATKDSNQACVMDLFSQEAPGLKIAGRLDKDTTGLLLLSDDGQWIHRITSPNFRCEKTYQVKLDSLVSEQTLRQFANGIQLRSEDKPTLPARIENIKGTSCDVILNEGRYHQVKRMFAACGHHVLALHRSEIGGIMLDSKLQPGDYRVLSEDELASVAT